MGFLWEMIRSFLDKCYFWLPNKFITRPVADAMVGFADQPMGSGLQTESWKNFQYAFGDTPLILVGLDGGTADFIQKYKDNFQISAVVADEIGDRQDFMGYRLIELSELGKMELSGKTIVITSVYYYRLYSGILDDLEISYYSYPYMICRKPIVRFFRPLYLFRYRWLHFILSPDGFFKNYFLFYLRRIFRLLHLTPHNANYARLKALKDCHKGERCFVVATGPSLRVEDLERLRGEVTFGVNSIFKIFEQTDWRPTYYTICDSKVFDQYLREGNSLEFDQFCTEQAIIADTLNLSRLPSTPDLQKIVRVPFSYLNHFTTAIHVAQKYSVDPVKGLYNAQTVTNFAINLAQYMGFSEIYLLGVDFKYTKAAHHFDGSICDFMLDDVLKQRTLDGTLDCYEMVAKETKKAGIQVFNASRETNLKTFQCIDFDQLPFLPPPPEKVLRVEENLGGSEEMHRLTEEGEPKFEYMVSVIVLTYNHEKYIRDALESILMQRVNFSYEVLVGEDASTDDTREILREYEEQYPSIFKMVYRQENVGPTRNAYDLLMAAKGKYIANLEGDDYWTDPYKLQKQVMFLEKNLEYIATVHNCFIVDENKTIIDRNPSQYSRAKEYTASELEKWLLPGSVASLIYRNFYLTEPKRDYTSLYKIDPMLGDTTTVMMLVSQGRFYKFPDVMSHYRRVYKSGSSWSAVSLFDRRATIYFTMDRLKFFAQNDFGKTLDFSEQQAMLRYNLFLRYADDPTKHKREVIDKILLQAGEKEKEYRHLLRKTIFKTPARKMKYRYWDWKKQRKSTKNSVAYLREESDRQWRMNYERSIITREKVDKVIGQNEALLRAILKCEWKVDTLRKTLSINLSEADSEALVQAFCNNDGFELFYPKEELEWGKLSSMKRVEEEPATADK